jgi:hypothetical protein
MSDTTSILDLRTDPIGGGGGNISNNISLTASENTVVQPTNMTASHPQIPNSTSLDEKTISQIVNGLQQASATGATLLQSRDIPMTTTGISNDPYVQPNYVPMQQQNTDYIRNSEQTSDMIDDYNRSVHQSDSLDDIYNEIQTPLLLAVLYFLFQLPILRKLLFNYMPFIFSQDGNLNINGLIFKSILFGLLFYILDKSTQTFSKF